MNLTFCFSLSWMPYSLFFLRIWPPGLRLVSFLA